MSGVKTRTRQAEILRLLKRQGRATVEDLAERLETTPQTVRKDLTALAEGNQIIRFHGGATLAVGTEYTSFNARCEILKEEKDLIGRLVASEIPNHASVMLNGGTTTAAVARNLARHIGLKVVVDSVYIADILRKFPGLEVMVPGGMVRGSDGAVLGSSAIEFIRQFRADISIVGAAAIASDGALLDYDLAEIAVSRAIMESGRNTILAVDSSKYDRHAPVQFGDLSRVDVLVTDAGCPEGLGDLCALQGVRLVRPE